MNLGQREFENMISIHLILLFGIKQETLDPRVHVKSE